MEEGEGSGGVKRGHGAVEEGREGEGGGGVKQTSKRRKIKEGDGSPSDNVDAAVRDSLTPKHSKGRVFQPIVAANCDSIFFYVQNFQWRNLMSVSLTLVAVSHASRYVVTLLRLVPLL